MTDHRKPTRTERDVFDVDPLIELEGLGRAAERDLRSMGIHRFAELATYTSERLAEELLQKTGNARYTVGLIESHDWIGQAQRKVAELKMLEEKKPTEAKQPEMRVKRHDPSKSGRQFGDWDLHAEFNLYFESRTSDLRETTWQTRVWKTRRRIKDSDGEKVEECDDEKTFAGVDPDLWSRWILSQAQLTGKQPIVKLQSSPPSLSSKMTPDIEIAILSVVVSKADQPSVLNEKQLSTLVRFQIAGQDAARLVSEKAWYQTHIGAISQTTSASTWFSSRPTRFQPGVFEYEITANCPIPALGRYKWQSKVSLSPPNEYESAPMDATVTILP